MKKVIDGKMYNTETAKLLANYTTNGLSMSDFRYEDTSLYVTKSGRYFLAGEGHGMSRWAHSNGNTRGWGKGIEAVTIKEALAWIEVNKIDFDEMLSEFFKKDIEEA